MNANELADKLENELNIFENRFVCDAATMLRQQQAEIEALKAELRGIDELITGKAQEK